MSANYASKTPSPITSNVFLGGLMAQIKVNPGKFGNRDVDQRSIPACAAMSEKDQRVKMFN